MNLLSLSCPKKKATLQHSLTLRQSELNDKFVVARYYHPVPEAEYQGGYETGDCFDNLVDAIVEFEDRVAEILERYRSHPEIMETKSGSVPGFSILFEFKMEVLAGMSFQPIYLTEISRPSTDPLYRPLQFFVVSTETEDFPLDGWNRAIDSFSSEVNEQLSRVTLNLMKGRRR